MNRWKINLTTLWISQVMSLASFGLGLPFIPFFIQELGMTDPAEIKIYTGILAVAPAVTMAFMAPIWGILSDRFGRKMMIMRAMGAAVLIIGLMGMATEVWHLVALRALQGVFTGTITASSTFIAANTPKDKLTYALGAMSSSNFIGYSIGPLVGGYIAEYFGYRMSFMAGALLMLLGFILVLKLLKEDPHSYGQKRDASLPQLKWHSILSTYIVLMLLMLFFHRISRTVFNPYLPLYIQEVLGGVKGASQLTGTINGITGFATALAGIFFGRLGDKVHKMKLSVVLLILSSFLGFGLYFTPTLTVFSVFYGLLFFLIGGVEPVITASMAERTPSHQRGLLFGIQGLMGSLGWVMSPVIGTWISLSFETKAILFAIPCALMCSTIIAGVSIRHERLGNLS
jgi:DHA1 family multidrug resistance protein-like MFS transporter